MDAFGWVHRKGKVRQPTHVGFAVIGERFCSSTHMHPIKTRGAAPLAEPLEECHCVHYFRAPPHKANGIDPNRMATVAGKV